MKTSVTFFDESRVQELAETELTNFEGDSTKNSAIIMIFKSTVSQGLITL